MDNSLLSVFMILNSNKESKNYLVGGCVRDMILGIVPNDYDIVTNIDYETLVKIFTDNGWNINETGKEFLVLRISKDCHKLVEDIYNNFYILERVEYEIANFRTDGNSFTDGRRPDKVDIGDINSDANRRDFTINAIYYEPLSGEYHDPLNGKDDCENKVLKFIGNPVKRIEEDYLRVFRAYRFISKGFKPTTKTLKVIREYFNIAYEKTNAERIRLEIEKMIGII